MKKDTHPTYNKATHIQCACGNNFAVGATKENMQVEICSQCHPYYTGKEKIVDAAGRVEKFRARASQASKAKKSAK